jgi:hypothetical protein
MSFSLQLLYPKEKERIGRSTGVDSWITEKCLPVPRIEPRFASHVAHGLVTIPTAVPVYDLVVTSIRVL